MIIIIVSGGGENLLLVPTFLSGIVGLFHIIIYALLLKTGSLYNAIQGI